MALANHSDSFLYSLTPFHAIGFGVAFFLSLLLLLAGVYWAYRPKTSLVLQMASLGMLLAGPIGAYHLVESYYKPAHFKDLTIQYLYYQDKALVQGQVFSDATHPLSECFIRAKAYEPPKGSLDLILKLISPIASGEKRLQGVIRPQTPHHFSLEIPGPRYDDNLSVSLKLRCR